MSLKLGNTTIGSLYLGSTKITEAYLGSSKIYSSVVAPFTEVDSSLWDNQVGIEWQGTPGISTSYLTTIQQPNNSMLYRKVTVNAPVTITKFEINANVGTLQSSNSGERDWSPSSIPSKYGSWPSCVHIYDSNLNAITINSQESTSTTVLGIEVTYSITASGWWWYMVTCECNVTLQPGYYWWPLAFRRHSRGSLKNTYGYYAGVSGDMLALRQWNVTDNTTYPPLYLQTTNRPYLKLTDSNNRDWYV